VNIAYVVYGINGAMYMMNMQCCVNMVLCPCWICSVVYRSCYVHVGYAVLCTNGDLCMLYIWCCSHDCTSGVVNMCFRVHVPHVVLCTCCACDAMYMWCCAHVMHVMLRTFGIVYTLYSGVVYMWHCVHVVQVVPCTCHVCTHFAGGCSVQVVLCTCGKYGTNVDASIACCCMKCVDVCV